MFDYHLFLAFPVSSNFEKNLLMLENSFYQLFVNTHDSIYLREIFVENQRYLGKNLGGMAENGSLEALQSNLFSLLRKLVPDYPYAHEELILLAIPNEQQ